MAQLAGPTQRSEQDDGAVDGEDAGEVQLRQSQGPVWTPTLQRAPRPTFLLTGHEGSAQVQIRQTRPGGGETFHQIYSKNNNFNCPPQFVHGSREAVTCLLHKYHHNMQLASPGSLLLLLSFLLSENKEILQKKKKILLKTLSHILK